MNAIIILKQKQATLSATFHDTKCRPTNGRSTVWELLPFDWCVVQLPWCLVASTEECLYHYKVRREKKSVPSHSDSDCHSVHRFINKLSG